ncbi:MAG TPA: cobalamin-dependent protein [Methanospirillum sp.]|mgnify:CR=1 FL=1|uniref:cobalamin B12-binding domain-containing protein n=1 Tax=Methanospirillum sp. TaxID=45200 RepID=UPI002C1D0875|nr:cobalamin-dependent protein [Methanospirillum sp.]HOJ96244.1 cobalamin-dependent protein [Methanospirillum sp.]HOL40905.1 cobalamin-dependent protein [Methanospirillum sp.]HPP77263.1 cobalamin-dependent protein [Methanospirillum sp.]
MDTHIPPNIYQAYLTALIAGDRITCTDIVQDLRTSGTDIKEIYLHLIQRSLYDVGDLWEHHRISVAVEHLASAITERLLSILETEMFSIPHKTHTVIVACIADEFHQIGGRMVSDMFEFQGWNSHFLGANTPVRDLISMMQRKKPDLIALSVSVYFNIPHLLSALTIIRTQFPSIQILAGGQAFRWGGEGLLERYQPIKYIRDLDELESWIETYEREYREVYQ